MWEPAQVDVLFLLDAPEAISELQAISDAGAGGSPVARGVGDLTKIWSYNGDLCIYIYGYESKPWYHSWTPSHSW